MWMHEIFRKPKPPACLPIPACDRPITKRDLTEMEQRLSEVIHGQDRELIQQLTDQLRTSAAALKKSVEQNQMKGIA